MKKIMTEIVIQCNVLVLKFISNKCYEHTNY